MGNLRCPFCKKKVGKETIEYAICKFCKKSLKVKFIPYLEKKKTHEHKTIKR